MKFKIKAAAAAFAAVALFSVGTMPASAQTLSGYTSWRRRNSRACSPRSPRPAPARLSLCIPTPTGVSIRSSGSERSQAATQE